MQPEDIIQQKQWEQLTAAEKAIVLPLASSAEEFMLMKHILMNAIEDETPLPAISITVQQQLQQAVIAHGRRRSLKKYYYAAAAMLVSAFAVWLVFEKNSNAEQNMITMGDAIKLDKDIDRYILKPGNTTSVGEKQEPDNITSFKKTEPVRKNIFKDIVDSAPDIAINTKINDDENMLSMVTEVY